jgi:hypothetical protein
VSEANGRGIASRTDPVITALARVTRFVALPVCCGWIFLRVWNGLGEPWRLSNGPIEAR